MRILILSILFIIPLFLNAQTPHKFSPGDPVSADKFNENFAYIQNLASDHWFNFFLDPSDNFTYFDIYIEKDDSYTIPNDKDFFVYNGSSISSTHLKIGDETFFRYAPGSSQSVIDESFRGTFPPIVIKRGSVIKPDYYYSGIYLNGILGKARHEIINIFIDNTNTYTVPEGKVAYLFTAAADQHTYLQVDDKSILKMYHNSQFYNFHPPLMISSGRILKPQGTIAKISITGFLISK